MLRPDERIVLHAVENGIIYTRDRYDDEERCFIGAKVMVYQDVDILLEDLSETLKHGVG